MEAAKKGSRERLVQATASRLRERIVSCPPNSQIGSAPEIAKWLGVGTVTVQQAARLLEHEGFLEVRRGPGGGYYGVRPDEAALARAISAFLVAHRSQSHEAINIMTLLDCELMPAAARSENGAEKAKLRALGETIDTRSTSEQRVSFENEMHDILFRMINQPLIEVLARVTMQHYDEYPHVGIYQGDEGLRLWRKERHKIIDAILGNDPDLARFEAMRRRLEIIKRLDLA